MKKTIIPFFFLLFLALAVNVSGYEISYVIQDDGTSNHYTQLPSVYWKNSCDVNITLYVTASNPSLYTLTNRWYSPNSIQKLYGIFTSISPITCRNLGKATSSENLNDYYEASTSTTTTANITNTWANVTYTCNTDENDLFIYNNTMETDSFGNFPYAYYKRLWTCCQTGVCSTPSSDSQLAQMINYLEDGYYERCSSTDLAVDTQESFGCDSNRYMGLSHWIAVPFNSMESGTVNISVEDINHYATGTNTMIQSRLYYIYLWDSYTNETTFLNSGVGYSTTQNLIENRDYWLLIGKLSYGWSGNGGSFTYNNTDYNITISAYEPDWLCGDWSECLEGTRQRICTDQNGIIPDKIETEDCYRATSTFLGFEDYYEADVYLCNYGDVNPTCSPPNGVLNTITAKYPEGWTVIGYFDSTGTNRANNIEVSQDFNRNSLKMWYIPPKPVEPVADSPTTCGNATTGRFPEITSPFNETLFVETNVTFASPYPEITYLTRKCNEPVLQYDYTSGWLFNCGKRCYASNCSEEPEGRYGIAISDYSSYIVDIDTEFNITDKAGVDYTDQIKNYSSEQMQNHNKLVYYANITIKDGYFINGTKINIYYRSPYSATKTINVTNNDLTQSYATFSNAGLGSQWSNITLSNIQGQQKSIILTNVTTPYFTFYYKYIGILIPTNFTTASTLATYFDDAPDYWKNKTIDLSGLGLTVGHNYTVSVAVNPQNQLYPYSHCVYFSDFRVNFRETEPPECISRCDGFTYIEAQLQDSTCILTYRENSPECIRDRESRSIIEDIIQGKGGGDITDNSTCIDTDNDGIKESLFIWYPESQDWDIIANSEVCNQTETIILSLYEPPYFVQQVLNEFGVTKADFGYVWFFFSVFMLINYVAVGIASGVSIYIRPGEGKESFGFVPFLAIVLIIIVSALFSGFYPLEIGIPVIVGVGLMLWKQMEGIIGSKR